MRRPLRPVAGWLRATVACLLLLSSAALAADPPPLPCGEPAASAAEPVRRPTTDHELREQACADARRKPQPTSIPTLYGDKYRTDGGPFAKQVKHAHDGLTRKVRDWEWRSTDEPKKPDPKKPANPRDVHAPSWLDQFADILGWIVNYGLWILVGVLVCVALWYHRSWISWIRELEVPEAGSSIETVAVEPPPPLPDDIPAAVRALWQRGEQRSALALLYQAAVQRLAERLGTPLPPGATEGECLSRSRKLNDRRYAGLFSRIVNCWQAAAYARRMPETPVLESLLDEWAQRPVQVNA